MSKNSIANLIIIAIILDRLLMIFRVTSNAFIRTVLVLLVAFAGAVYLFYRWCDKEWKRIKKDFRRN